jgi:hypothetical protein
MPYINTEDRNQLRMVSYEDSITSDCYVRRLMKANRIVQENPEEWMRYEVLLLVRRLTGTMNSSGFSVICIPITEQLPFSKGNSAN